MPERLRSATADDSSELAVIDALANPSPWRAEAFAETLGRASGIVMLGERGAIDGFVVYSIAADECEILTIAVRPERWRNGTGRALLEEALRRASGREAQRCFLEVRASNRAARNLYLRCGFMVDGRRRAYYRDGAGGPEDALLMSRELDGVPE